MNIREYIHGKYRSANTNFYALSNREALALDIPLPMKTGWLSIHGHRQITLDQARALIAVHLRQCQRPSERKKVFAQNAINALEGIFGPMRDVEPAGKMTRSAEKRAVRQARKPRQALPPPPPRYGDVPDSLNVTSDAFLQSYEWRRVRMAVLKRDGARCACCGATPGSGTKMHVDHIKPRRVFPELALHMDNLQVLCHECNHGKGNWDMTDWRSSSKEEQ